jgi:hypothetical protein
MTIAAAAPSLRQCLKRRVRTRAFVHFKYCRGCFCLCGVAICAVRDHGRFHFHGHDFVLEFSGGNCGERLLVARE